MAASHDAGRMATTLPESNAGYLQPSYWDARFEQEAEYEWFRGCVPARRHRSWRLICHAMCALGRAATSTSGT